ncbi:MAG: SoxR reducing system RseC family protein [Candidatus Mcinerneyibacterium aminivorans]|uniref:SoxR reducing system RseC family protein n=1 Tax=Candidatus Mcinerneyibacterium aminivorans TaxID=2703815 RepID=A0A5D0MIQ0_9BACT|nr:MAG: SoxR reducing system RseC family protein [Candidatus Mcinerneyibacterium aminivorans]
MKKKACVNKLSDDKVILSIYEEDKCESCGLCGGEQTISLKKEYFQSEIQKGDFVEIEYKLNKTFAAFLVFFLPLIFMIVGYIIFNTVFLLGENLSILGSVAGLILSAGVIKIFDIKNRNKGKPEIKLIRRQK